MFRTENSAPHVVEKTDRRVEALRELEDLAAAYGARLPAAFIASFTSVHAVETTPRASGI